MKHMFDSETAEKYGVNAAILFANLAFWIEKNAKDGVNFRDGRYWTYCSRRMFRERFPYLTERQIGTALQKLTDAGLIITGCFNNFGRDRTLWYALSEKGQALNDRPGAETTDCEDANAEAREPECQTDSAETSNGTGGNVTPVQDKAGKALNDRPGAETTDCEDANAEAKEAEWQTDSAETSNGTGGNATPTQDKTGKALNDRPGAETTDCEDANAEAREPECQTDSAETSNGTGGNATPTQDKAEDKAPSPLPLTAVKEGERAAKGEKYGEFVTMTREEYRSLEERYGAERTKLATEILDNYKGATGKRYKSDYRAVLSWSMERAGEKMRAGRRPREPAGDGGGFTPSDGFADWSFSPADA